MKDLIIVVVALFVGITLDETQSIFTLTFTTGL